MEEEHRRDERSDPQPADQAEAAYRGFLFADLRGYTAFVERYGDSAAADLLDAYRELVRAEVAHHAGAEIRTEGDSFYVVFASARRAVACGLAIVAAAEQASREHPDRPVRVGIGINAGETVQRGEGFVGTAVNLAARVCAQAREGEVLVTAAVGEALGTTPGLQLTSRGTRRLKGITRPVALFAVERRHAAARRAPSIARRRLAIAGLMLGALVAGIGIWAAAAGQRQPATVDTPSSVMSEVAHASVSPVPTTSALADPSIFPNSAEAGLLDMVGERIEPHCDRADEDDRPVIIVDPVQAKLFGTSPEDLRVAHFGIECDIPSVAAPDSVHLWVTRVFADYDAVDIPEALIIGRADRDGIRRGDCSNGVPALEAWGIGDIGGWLLCRESNGQAVIEWSYEGHPIFGRAVRRDADLASLVDWWTEEARLLAP